MSLEFLTSVLMSRTFDEMEGTFIKVARHNFPHFQEVIRNEYLLKQTCPLLILDNWKSLFTEAPETMEESVAGEVNVW